MLLKLKKNQSSIFFFINRHEKFRFFAVTALVKINLEISTFCCIFTIMKAFIYAIKNVINNKVYVGSTRSLTCRKQDHFSALRRKNHANEHLQKSYNKYGKDKFHFYTLEECTTENRKEREIYWINKLNSFNRDYGYNIYQPNVDKFQCHEETKIKLQKANIKNGKSIPINMYTANLEFVGTFDSSHHCSRIYNLYPHIINQIINGKRLTYKGYTFFKKDEVPYIRQSSKQRNMEKYRK